MLKQIIKKFLCSDAGKIIVTALLTHFLRRLREKGYDLCHNENDHAVMPGGVREQAMIEDFISSDLDKIRP